MADTSKNNKQKINLRNPEYYINRELSWLEFNTSCLSEARNHENPLFERLKFLSITASNLDEFFMVRVASLLDMVNAGYEKKDIAGLTAEEQLKKIGQKAREFVELQYSTYNRSFLPLLSQEKLEIVEEFTDLTADEKSFLDRYYREEVFPVLTPMAVDSSRPFPLVRNRTLNMAALLKRRTDEDGNIPQLVRNTKKHENELALVQVPSVLPRVIVLGKGEEEGAPLRIMLLENLIRYMMPGLFQHYQIQSCGTFRIMRSADLSIEEDEEGDLLKEIEKQLKKRQRSQVIRLEYESGMDKKLVKRLVDNLKVSEDARYPIDGPVDLTFLMKVYGLEGFDHLKEHGYEKPVENPAFLYPGSVFEKIAKKDILLHHPYESFDPVVAFVEEAASDPDVLAIKQTLYRVSGNSPIIASLSKAAENGKQVTVLVELKARFDEEHNILWARMLEKAGAHVIYGLVGLKTHSKITLVVRREEDGIRRYVHLGTGNYNDSTAKLYTDIGLLTCDQQIGEDATAFFNMISGYNEPAFWNKLILAPLWMKKRFIDLIHRERDNALSGAESGIIAKMNSLCDPDIMEALYEASCAGVKIDLIVRGICCIRTGIPGVSENITVRSIVGNFLEHARIFCFKNAGAYEIYAGSADWMPRNLDRRVEIVFPLEDEELKAKAMHILTSQLSDTEKAHILQPDGSYARVDRRGKLPVNSQQLFGDEAAGAVKEIRNADRSTRVFIPETGQKG